MSARKSEDQAAASTASPPTYRKEQAESPDIPDSSSSSSSSLSDTDHPAHRSQLFKRPPRFKQQRPRDLATFEEADDNPEVGNSGSQGSPVLPFANAAKRPQGSTKYAQDTLFRTRSKPEQKVLQSEPRRIVTPIRQKSIDQQSQATTETASSMTSSSDAPAGPQSATKSPMSPPDHRRAELARLGSPRQRSLMSKREGSEGTPSMGSSFSDIDGPSQFLKLVWNILTRDRCRYKPVGVGGSVAEQYATRKDAYAESHVSIHLRYWVHRLGARFMNGKADTWLCSHNRIFRAPSLSPKHAPGTNFGT